MKNHWKSLLGCASLLHFFVFPGIPASFFCIPCFPFASRLLHLAKTGSCPVFHAVLRVKQWQAAVPLDFSFREPASANNRLSASRRTDCPWGGLFAPPGAPHPQRDKLAALRWFCGSLPGGGGTSRGGSTAPKVRHVRSKCLAANY